MAGWSSSKLIKKIHALQLNLHGQNDLTRTQLWYLRILIGLNPA